jgi:GNAT superfamily N-acetyltransferase
MTKVQLTEQELEKYLEDPKNVLQVFMGAFVDKYGYDHSKVKAEIAESKNTATYWKGKEWYNTKENSALIGLFHKTFNIIFGEGTTDSIEVYMIETKKQGKGVGTRVMEQVLDLADDLGLDITLIPTAYKNQNDPQYLSFLRQWYYDLGFDHSAFSPVMKYKYETKTTWSV